MQIETLLEGYIRNRTIIGHSSDTISGCCRYVRAFVKRTGTSKLEDWTTEVILNDCYARLESGLRSSSVHGDVIKLRSLVKYAYEIGLTCPAEWKRICIKPRYRERSFLEAGQVRDIIAHARPDIATLITTIYTGGLRLTEALALKSADLRLDCTATITGKGGKQRLVFFTEDIVCQLKALAPDGGYCFRHKFKISDKPIPRMYAYDYIKAAMVKAGYPDAHPHSLRHGFATNLIRNGASLMHVQRMLGHSNPNVTARYVHLVSSDLAVAHAKFLDKV